MPDPGAAGFIASSAANSARETRLASMAEFPKTGASRLTQVRAIEGDLPVLRQDRDRAAASRAASSAQGRGALIEESLLLQYGFKHGDDLKIGGRAFPILGTCVKLPGEANAFASIAPRVLIPRAQLPR